MSKLREALEIITANIHKAEQEDNLSEQEDEALGELREASQHLSDAIDMLEEVWS